MQTITITKRNDSMIEFDTDHTFTSTMQEIEKLRKTNDFARSLWDSFGRYGNLSDAQMRWAYKLAEDNNPTVEAPIAPPQPRKQASYQGLLDWFNATGNKAPKITLEINGMTLKLDMKGAQSRKYEGQIMITDGKSYHNQTYYGRIDLAGNGCIVSNCPVWVLDRLNKWNEDPKSIFEEARAHGRKYYNCCFCCKDLTRGESKTAGYGPICAEKWGLPWGEIAEGINDPVEIADEGFANEMNQPDSVRIPEITEANPEGEPHMPYERPFNNEDAGDLNTMNAAGASEAASEEDDCPF